MDKVSVIVPVYKVEKELEHCVQSIQAQTYEHLEIILVDDGSPDQSGKICDRLAKEDPRIRVIHKTNGGLSSARNVGMDAATGDYVLFVDSDDWIDPPMVEILHHLCVSQGVELSECSYRSLFRDGVFEETDCSGQIVKVTAAEAIMHNLTWKLLKPVAWNKLYSRRVIGDIRYPVGKIHEDEFTTHKFYLAAGQIAYADISMYNYNRRREESITASFRLANLDMCEAFLEKIRLVWSRPELKELDEMMCNTYCFLLFRCLANCVRFHLSGPRVEETVQEALAIRDELYAHHIQQSYHQCFDVLQQEGLEALERHFKAAFEGGN